MSNHIMICIYHRGRLIEAVEAEPKTAWKLATSIVRYLGDGVPSWYQTANRVGYQRGDYRATPYRAHPRVSKPRVFRRRPRES